MGTMEALEAVGEEVNFLCCVSSSYPANIESFETSAARKTVYVCCVTSK